MAELEHNRIIKRAVSSVLKPNGLFQIGSSRTWIDDNGWFLTQVEFQPSGWDRGSCLNVGIYFPWRYDGSMGFDFSIGQCRVDDFVAFDGDEEKFFADMQGIANRALEKVEEYRKFRNPDYACAVRLGSEYGTDVHKLYQKMMICGLCQDSRAVRYFEELRKLVHEPEFAWIQKIKDELDEAISPIIGDPQELYGYILEKIRKNRRTLREKTSMKKLKESFPFNGESL